MTELYNALYKLFCTLQVYKQKLHSFHWHATGDNFYQIHLLFDVLYNLLQDFEDRFAEHLRGYGRTPSRFIDYIESSSITETKPMVDVGYMLAVAIEDLNTIRLDLSVANETATANKKYGTLNLLGELDETFDKMWYLLASNKKGFNLN